MLHKIKSARRCGKASEDCSRTDKERDTLFDVGWASRFSRSNLGCCEHLRRSFEVSKLGFIKLKNIFCTKFSKCTTKEISLFQIFWNFLKK